MLIMIALAVFTMTTNSFFHCRKKRLANALLIYRMRGRNWYNDLEHSVARILQNFEIHGFIYEL